MARTATLLSSTDPSLQSLRRAVLRQIAALTALLSVSSALCVLAPQSPRDMAQPVHASRAQAVLASDAAQAEDATQRR